jgi:hypothetical protein
MQSSEDRPVADQGVAAHADGIIRRIPSRITHRYTGTARTAPKGTDSRIGDEDTHRRLQEARNRARHSIEDMIRRELGPEWAYD